MDYLQKLEQRSIYILREAYYSFRRLGMLWSIGKDSTVMLWLARKAFFGHVPFTLIHIDTGFKIPEMIEYRDQLVQRWKLNLIFGRNDEALESKQTFPDGAIDRLSCCSLLKTDALRRTIDGSGSRYRVDPVNGCYTPCDDATPFSGVIAGVRSDEEGTRSKERYFSPRGLDSQWDIAQQPPELWDQYNTSFPPGTHVRVHPLLDWTELNIWEYIERENISTVSLYFDQGEGKRYRSLGCYPCTSPVASTARTPGEIVAELREGKFSRIAERAGRAQDSAGGGGLEKLRRGGYM